MFSSEKGLTGSQILIITLSQAVAYLLLWLWNEYVASYITLILPAMILVILVLAKIADWIEPSRMPGWYYVLMIVSIIIPLVIGIIFYFINNGKIEWG